MSDSKADSIHDPFETSLPSPRSDEARWPAREPVPLDRLFGSGSAVTARLQGFGLDDQPLVSGLPDLPGEVVAAQTILPLRHEMIGSKVVVLFEQGDVRRPIVMGVLQAPPSAEAAPAPGVVVANVDGQRLELCAEREIVLRCGEASITLTRAGKILIKGKYILSRSSGYNKIKGAAVDIN